MNLCVKKNEREIIDILWNVLTSFGIQETENLDCGIQPAQKLFCVSEYEVDVKEDYATTAARAEMAALCVESAVLSGLRDFTVCTGDVEVYDMLAAFGFEEHIELIDGAEGFTFKCFDNVIAEGKFGEEETSCRIYVKPILASIEQSGGGTGMDDIPVNVIFAEKDAEGLAYDIAVALRLNSTIAEYYTGGGTIEDAEKYGADKGAYAVMRVFADGKLQIKNIAADEITETSAQEFFDYYYEEDTDECDCGCGHDHDHGDCGCGHHHGH